jgi:hypothetical protein
VSTNILTDLISPSFESNQYGSPLLRLPAELRIKIWEYALGGNSIVPATWLPRRMRYVFCPSNIYIRAEPRENMLHFLSLLRVSRQIYREARLLPFLCNVWVCWGKSWDDLFNRMDEEQRRTIEWVGFENRRMWVGWPPPMWDEPNHCSPQLEDLPGMKVIVRRGPLHWDDEVHIEQLARVAGCRIVDERLPPLIGGFQILLSEILRIRGCTI